VTIFFTDFSGQTPLKMNR